MTDRKHDPELTLEQKVNLETARIRWQELQRQFAQGVLILVSNDIDLVKTAARFIDDDSENIQHLMDEKQIRKAEIQDAERWNQLDAELWAVVAAPWVLVQEINE